MTTPLDINIIRDRLDSAISSVDIAVAQSVDSTNDWCRRDFTEGVDPPFLRVAEAQQAGKGRRGRTWVSQQGGDIIMSLVRRLELPMSRLGCLSVAMGEAVAGCLRDRGLQDVSIKWPNDVLVAGSKLCGLLIESLHDAGSGTTIIIGIGMNIEPVPAGVSPYPVASLSELMEERPARDLLVADLVLAVERQCRRMEQDPEGLGIELDRLLDTGEIVDIRYDDGSVITGIMRGMNPGGELKVEVEGGLRLCNSADISLRRPEA